MVDIALESTKRLYQQSVSHFAAQCTENGQISDAQLGRHQIVLYDLAMLSTKLTAAEQLLLHARNLNGRTDPAARLTQELALLFAAETVRDGQTCFALREGFFGLTSASVAAHKAAVTSFTSTQLLPEHISAVAHILEQVGHAGEDGLTEEHRAVQAAFRSFAMKKITPIAEQIHREDLLLPDSIIKNLGQMGCFGLTIPGQYGGFQENEEADHIAMVIVSDELSRASVGSAGSLNTRTEILSKALLKGGTELQKSKWLPLIATGERLVAVAVTEPDHGSAVIDIRTTARRVNGGWRLSGPKMWCTLAGRADILLVLARANQDSSATAANDLSLFIVEKPAAYSHSFDFEIDDGRMSGQAIPTLGYRGLHSFELAFDNLFVPDENLIGLEAGIGEGAALLMQGFFGSWVQTAARALGVMAAALETGLTYAQQRLVYGRRLWEYPLTQQKLVRMAMLIQAGRRLTFYAAQELDKAPAATAGAMAKILTAEMAEWVTREAQQLHGGLGYAEEYPISRHFVDARVLSIFEGTQEVLALHVIAKSLLEKELRGHIA